LFQLAPTLAAALNVPVDRLRHVKIVTNSEPARQWLQLLTPFLVVSTVPTISLQANMYKRMTPGFTSTYDLDPTIPLPSMASGVQCSEFLRELIRGQYMAYVTNTLRKSPAVYAKYIESSLASSGDDLVPVIVDRDQARELIREAGGEAYLSRVVLLRRSSRDIINSDELYEALSLALGGPPTLFYGNESEAATAFTFYHADVIIGYHGAGLANALFSAHGTRIIEVGDYLCVMCDQTTACLSVCLSLRCKRSCSDCLCVFGV
jgi:hypothetical protein